MIITASLHDFVAFLEVTSLAKNLNIVNRIISALGNRNFVIIMYWVACSAFDTFSAISFINRPHYFPWYILVR